MNYGLYTLKIAWVCFVDDLYIPLKCTRVGRVNRYYFYIYIKFSHTSVSKNYHWRTYKHESVGAFYLHSP